MWVKLVKLGFAIIFGALIVSAIKSGYFYQFDGDELFHSQAVYLISGGAKTYTSFLFIGYSPILQWLLVPFYRSMNFTFDALYAGRYLLIVLFLLRIGLMFNFMRLLLGFRAGIVTVALVLLDSLTIFTAMQIRPDNLMIVFFCLALNFLVLGQNKRYLLLLAGFFFGMSIVSLAKIAPAVIVIGIGACLWFWKKKQLDQIRDLVVGGVVAMTLFFGYFAIDGRLGEVINQVLIYPPKMFTNFQYPIPFGFFYHGDNPALLGQPGRPPHWLFLWILLFLFGSGLFTGLTTVFREKVLHFKHILLFCFAIGFSVQFYFISQIQSPFVQYYMPVHFFGTLLASYLLVSYLEIVEKRLPRIVIAVASLCVFSYFAVSMVQGNINRSAIGNDEIRKRHEAIWSVVPANEAIYPRVLFRPIVTNIIWEHFLGDASPFLLSILPDFSKFFESRTVKYIYNASYLLSFYPEPFRAYIAKNYVPSPKTADVLIRKE